MVGPDCDPLLGWRNVAQFLKCTPVTLHWFSGMIIAIEGGIGAGKTTTAQIVAQRLGSDVVLERTQAHPFLAAFYEHPTRFALETELGFVLLHYHQLHTISESALVVTDFSPVKDIAFARMNLHGEELALFDHVYQRLISRLSQPALSVFLDLDVDEALNRIRNRGHSYELAVTKEYLRRLREAYGEILDRLASHVRLVQILPGDAREAVAEKVLCAIRESQILDAFRA
jgi:deoxyadenosine/deoxycytidine kinase